MYCKKCGNEIKENEVYCSKCGEKVANVIKSEQSDEKKPIKIKFGYCVIGIIIALVIISVIIAYVSGSKTPLNSATTSAMQTSIDTKILNTTKSTTQDENKNMPIYIGKTYISKGDDVTYYITFLSSTDYKYVAKSKYENLVPDITMTGTYEIEDNVITTVTNLRGTYIRENYTIVDKNTIKSKSSTYKVDNN